jgi:hypothetical protein
MSSKRVRLIALTGIVLIVLVIGISILVSFLSKDTREVPLPDTSVPSSPDETAGSASGHGLEQITVTKENVQNVIATLERVRPASYSSSIHIEILYEGDSTQYTIGTSVLNGAAALLKSGDGPNEHIIITGGRLYIWYDGDKTLYERPVLSPEDKKKSSDAYQMIMTYEDILELDKSSITDAGYVDYVDTGENCIYVQYVTELLGYTAKCYISVDSGLLIHAEKYDGDTLIYKMTTSEFSRTEPDSSVFELPDGTNPLSAP